jgi:hypothetical protein
MNKPWKHMFMNAITNEINRTDSRVLGKVWVRGLITLLLQAGLRVSVVDGKLKTAYPKGAFTAQLMQLVKNHKQKLFDYLSRDKNSVSDSEQKVLQRNIERHEVLRTDSSRCETFNQWLAQLRRINLEAQAELGWQQVIHSINSTIKTTLNQTEHN